MKTTQLNIKLTFTEPLLGTASGNPELHSEFIAAKADTEAKTSEEVAAIDVPESIEKASTVFPRDEKGLLLWDYQVRGFFKEAIGILTELGDAGALTKWTFKKAVDAALFITPRRIHLLQPNGQPWTKAPSHLERPLRAETMQGDRVALARSEVLPEGTGISFSVTILSGSNSKSRLNAIDRDLVVAALNLGSLRGIGQWRNASYGRFTWREDNA